MVLPRRAESGSKKSFRGSTWRERRQKGYEDEEYEQEEGQSGLGEGSFQTYRTIFNALRRNRFDKKDEEFERKDEELECLRSLVRDLELEARGRRRRRDYEECEERSTSVGGRHGAGSYQSGSHRHRDRSREYTDRDSVSLEEQRPQNAAIDAISRTLRRAT